MNTRSGHNDGLPLAGIRILAIEQMQALPYATQLLGRFGADVVKIEPPGTGESGRQAFPFVLDAAGRRLGSTFVRNNLGKRSIAVNLKDPRGRDLVLALVPRFDVVAQNFKAGTIDRLGLGYDAVAAVHPTVIYVSVSGFGTTTDTPYEGWPAYAPIAEGLAALGEWTRRGDAPPVVSPAGALGDTGSALFAAIGILAALRRRDATGESQHVDIAMYDAMVAMNDAAFTYWSMGMQGSLIPPLINHAFRARDGWFVLQCGRMHQFEALAKVVGCEEWLDDPRLPDAPAWLEHLDDVIRPGIERWSAVRERSEVCSILSAVGVAVGPVHTTVDVIHDPHVAARHMLVEIPRVDGVDVPVLAAGNPVKLSGMPEPSANTVPSVGEGTAELLGEELGLDDDTLRTLQADGVIGGL